MLLPRLPCFTELGFHLGMGLSTARSYLDYVAVWGTEDSLKSKIVK